MRRRERYAGVVWFEGFADDEASRRVADKPVTLNGMAGYLHRLCGRHGYFVEITPDVDRYQVRLFPHRPWATLNQPPVAFLYSGSDVRSILAAALHELDILNMGTRQYTTAAREVERWVP